MAHGRYVWGLGFLGVGFPVWPILDKLWGSGFVYGL